MKHLDKPLKVILQRHRKSPARATPTLGLTGRGGTSEDETRQVFVPAQLGETLVDIGGVDVHGLPSQLSGTKTHVV